MFELTENNGLLDIKITNKVMELMQYKTLSLKFERHMVYDSLRYELKQEIDHYMRAHPNSICVKKIIACINYIRANKEDRSSEEFYLHMENYEDGFRGIFTQEALNIMDSIEDEDRSLSNDILFYFVLRL